MLFKDKIIKFEFIQNQLYQNQVKVNKTYLAF